MLPEKASEQSKTTSSDDKLELEQATRVRRVQGGRVVVTPEAEAPYKVVLQYFDGEETEHPFYTVREGEDSIRGEFPIPRGTSRPLRTPPI
jgi:hypothetical protein